jgi:hypothetical protein
VITGAATARFAAHPRSSAITGAEKSLGSHRQESFMITGANSNADRLRSAGSHALTRRDG